MINYRYICALARLDTGPTCLTAPTQYSRGKMKHRTQAHFSGPISNCDNLLLDFQANTSYFYHTDACTWEQLPESNHKDASLLSFKFLLKIYLASDVNQELTTAKCWDCSLVPSSLSRCSQIFSPVLLHYTSLMRRTYSDGQQNWEIRIALPFPNSLHTILKNIIKHIVACPWLLWSQKAPWVQEPLQKGGNSSYSNKRNNTKNSQLFDMLTGYQIWTY